MLQNRFRSEIIFTLFSFCIYTKGAESKLAIYTSPEKKPFHIDILLIFPIIISTTFESHIYKIINILPNKRFKHIPLFFSNLRPSQYTQPE